MSLHPFPLAAADSPTCTLWQVRQALGRADYSDQRFVIYLQGLVDALGFPPPFPSQRKGQPTTRAVTPHSSFRRDAVNAWLDDYLPPACARALDAQAHSAAAAAMDQAALGLGKKLTLVGGLEA